MSQVIKIKHSTTTGNKPTSLSSGELALNVSDGHFFFGDGSNVQNYLHIGNTTASTLSITKTLVVTGQTVIAGTLKVDGNITGATNVHVGGDLFTDQIRRAGSNAQTTKTNMDANAQKFYVGDSSDEVLKILSDNIVVQKPLNISGDTNVDGAINMNAHHITNLRTPGNPLEAANKLYVDLYATSGVSSVAISGSDGIDVDSGSPITSSGTIALGLSNVPNSSLANSAVSYGGVSVSLGASDGTPAFNLSDATAYPGDGSLITTGTITTGTWNSNRLFTEQTDACGYMADYVTFGDLEDELICGYVYQYNGTSWDLSDASGPATSKGLIAIARGSAPADGMVLRGMFGGLPYDPGSTAEPLYLSETAGEITSVAPTTSAAVVRVVGYALSDSPIIWWNPDNTWVELT